MNKGLEKYRGCRESHLTVETTRQQLSFVGARNVDILIDYMEIDEPKKLQVSYM